MVFFPRHIEMLLDQGNFVDLACNVTKPINPFLLKRGCKVFNIAFARNPFNKENYMAYKALKSLISRENYNIVHTHTPTASVCVRLACRDMKNVKVFYTAHGFHFFTGAPIINWLLYYPVERWLSRFTDVLVTINQEDYQRATKSFKARRVAYVPGVGIDIERFRNVAIDKTAKRQEISVPYNALILLSVGELIKRKNHETIIKTIARLNEANIYYLICGSGQMEEYLRGLIAELGLEKQVILLGPRNDIKEICKIADIFIHPSFQEGLPVALMEAMASGLPCIASRIRGNTDLIQDVKGGYLCKPDDVDGFRQAIERLAADESTRRLMGEYNQDKIMDFDISRILLEMKSLYEREWEQENQNITSITQ
jgi:glycosyltransferase involved in cell wall biosynthesis